VYANGFVDLHASSPVPSLPLTAIGNDAGQPIVWTVENGVLNRRPVELGLRDVNQGFVEIRKGVAANVPVVATKLDDLKEGAPARAVGAVDTQATPPAPAAKPQAHA
jgi:hypothetical protein